MSYSETFHATVTVSGTVSVRYPASQNGGVTTASYHETVPVDWTVHVDTTPFDESVRDTELALQDLTGSVTAMNAAQVHSIRTASRKVAKRLSGGFYNLIGKDLSEKMVTQVNTTRSKFALLMQFSQDLLAKQDRMDEDVARLRRHYSSLFDGLDEDLNHRISALDKPAFTLGQSRREELLRGPFLTDAAFCLEGIREGDTAANQLVRARTNRSVRTALGALGDYVRKSLAYKEILSDMLEVDAAETEMKEYVPVLVMEGRDMEDPGGTFALCVPPMMAGADAVERGVSQHVQSLPDAAWSAIDRDALDKIDRAFCSFVEQDSQASRDPGSDRIHQQIMRMWGSNKNNIREIQAR